MGEARTDVKINVGEGAKSLRTLRQEFKEGQKELDGLVHGTKEYVDQLKHLANIKDEIGDLNQEINAFNPAAKLTSIIGVGKGIAAGFEAATAASALFGAESQDVEKAILKVQAAMAFANAVQEIGEIGKAFKLLGTVIKSAFASNPLTVLLVALAAAGTALAAFVMGTDDAEEASKRLDEQIKSSADDFKRYSDEIDFNTKKQKALAEAAGESQIKMLEIEKNAMNERLALAKKQANTDSQLLDSTKRRFGSESEEYKKAFENYQKTYDQYQKTKEEAEIFNITLQKKVADAQIAEFQEEEKNEEERSARHESRLKKEQDQLNKLAEERAKRAKEEAERKKNQELRDQADEGALAELQKTIDDNDSKEKDRKADEDAARLNYTAQQQEEIDKEATAKAAEESAKRRAIREAELSVATSIVDGLGSLAQLAGEQGGAMLEFQKGLAVAQIAIDTAKAISGAVAQAQSVPFPGNIVAIASGIATVLANIVKAKQILSQAGGAPSLNLPTRAASGGGSITPPNLNQVGSTATNLDNLRNGGKQGTPIVKAVVTETDITNSQKRVSRIIDKTKH